VNLDPSGRLTGLLKRADFVRVQNRGNRHRGRCLLLMVHPSESENSRVGLTVSRKVGNAVVRNRVRRRLRELIRAKPELFISGQDYVFIARARAATAGSSTLHKEVEWLLNQVSLQGGPPRSL
jgi:ribonuclease P protein component